MGSTLSDERTQDEQDRTRRRFKRRSCRINGEDCLSGWRSQPRVPQPPAKIRVQPSASLLTGVRLEPTLNPTTPKPPHQRAIRAHPKSNHPKASSLACD